ncbi:Fasciclin-like arabinogalactan protein 19 [Quillaja saponaria]|uniref:Fasciclin-like arabinogalactan protein 19 n=1 Tax=Quillaja saponaria TaxID=32244 RepID=A0AAD7P9G6_QUISA|nr:Fasciclin-like arabinogalactan protein 19 [Quillaja saponaria]
MASNSILLLFVFLLSLSNSVNSISTREFDSMLEILRVRGYNLFCNAIVTSDLQFYLLSSSINNTHSFTFFAPTDSSLFALDMTQTAASYTNTLRYHVVPRRLSISDLRRLSFGYSLPTLLPSRRLHVTRNLETGAVAVGGVDIVFPGLYYGREAAVHGLDGILSLRSTLRVVTGSPPLDAQASSPSHHVRSSLRSRSLLHSTSRIIQPHPPVRKISPINHTVGAPTPGSTAVYGRSTSDSTEILDSSSQISTESPASTYTFSPEVSPVFLLKSDSPEIDHSTISSPPIEDYRAARPLKPEVRSPTKARVSLLETSYSDDEELEATVEPLGRVLKTVPPLMDEGARRELMENEPKQSGPLDDTSNCLIPQVLFPLDQVISRHSYSSPMQCATP